MIELPRYEPPACASCRTMAPECLVPIGDGSAPMCWLCAHAVTVHDAEPGEPLSDCGCSPADVYPPDVLARRGRPQAPTCGTLPKLADVRPLMELRTPSYGRDGERDLNGPVLVQRYQFVAPGRVRFVDMSIQPPNHGERVSRGMKAARRAMVQG